MCLWFHSRTVVVWGSQSMLSTQKILADCTIACNVVFSIDVLVDAMLSFISLEFIICHGGTLSLTLHICLLGLEATTFYLVCCHHYNNKWFVDTIWYIYTYIIDLNPFVPLQLKINAIVVHVYIYQNTINYMYLKLPNVPNLVPDSLIWILYLPNT